MSDLLHDARSFVQSKMGGVDMSGIPEAAVRHAIESLYPGGWTAYEHDYRRFHAATEAALTEVLSPVKRKIKTEQWTERKLRPYDEIVKAEWTDLEVIIVLSVAEVEYGSRRDKVISRHLVLYKWTRSSITDAWTKDSLWVDDRVTEDHHRWGRIRDEERAESDAEQFETCYRPGTDKTPMQGWVARAELSHKQAHEDEVFQKPNPTT